MLRFVKGIGVGALFAIGAFVVGWHWREADRPVREEPNGSSHELRELQAELRRVKLMVRANQPAAQGRTSESSQITAAIEVKDGTPDLEPSSGAQTPEERKAAARERVERRASNVSAAMRSQSRDDVWATDTEHHVRQRVESLNPKEFPTTRLESVSCRQSICEVRVSHDTHKEAQAMYEVISEFPNVGATFGFRDHDLPGKSGTIVYLGRDGHVLPQ